MTSTPSHTRTTDSAGVRTSTGLRARLRPGSRLRGRLLRGRRGRSVVAAFAVGAALVGLLVAGSHERLPTTRIPLESGQAWVRSDRIGALTLLDGVAGQTVANVTVADRPGDALQATQSGMTGFALDRSAGTVTRIDGVTLTPRSDPRPLGGTGPQIALFPGAGTLYAVDGTTSEVTVYDAAGLRRLGTPVAFATGRTDYSAVVDAAGRLWVLDRGTGALTWFAGTVRHQRARAFAPGATTLTLADGSPVATDGTTGTAYRIGADGRTRGALPLGSTAADGIEVSGATGQEALLVTSARGGTYATCSFARGTCDRPIPVGFGEDTLGPAVATDGRVFVPDWTTGDAWLVDPTGATGARRLALLGHPARFEMFTRNGLVFYNDPGSDQAGTVAADGHVQPITKYTAATSSASAGSPATSPPQPGRTGPAGGLTHPATGSPGAHGAPDAPGTPSGTATTGPTATATGTGRPTGPAPSGTPGPTGSSGPPTPSPTPTGSGTVACGQTLTRSTVLTGDLRCAGTALVIGADHVTLDLGGHTVSGDGTGTGVVLRESRVPVTGTVVQNGTVTHFASGVAVGPDGATGTTLDMLDLRDDGTGDTGAAVDLGRATVAGLRLTQLTSTQSTGRFFASAGQTGGDVVLTGSTVTGGSFEFNEQPNVDVRLTMTDDSLDHAAVNLTNLEESVITDSTFVTSPLLDMCDHSGGDVIKDNRFKGPVYAVNIEDMAGENISGNQFSDNLVGVFLAIGDGDSGNTVTGNSFTGDTVAGLWLEDRATHAMEVRIDGNTAGGNGGSPGGRTDNGGNPVQGGLHLYAPAGGITVNRNHTGGNSGYGIWTVPGTATGSGNVSTGDDKQCAPLDLCDYA